VGACRIRRAAGNLEGVRVGLKLGSRQIKVGFYWRSGLSGLKADSSLKEIIEVIRQFVMPVVDAILTENADNKVWQQGEPWEKDRKL
jgi:hypothetical protein